MPGLSGALDIARWSMYASQLAIEVTANNVANANTAGYSKQTLELMANNAIKYVPAGGRVDVGWLQDEHGCALVVEDSGPGIAPAERQRVLQRFVRGQGAGGMAGGSGLGLAIAQSIAQSSGAQLWLDESPQLGGLRVRVVWPQS